MSVSHRNTTSLERLESCHCVVERLVCTTGSGVQLWRRICKAGRRAEASTMGGRRNDAQH